MKFVTSFLGSLVVLWCCVTLEATPFINPFNVAVKTEFGGEQNTLTFAYPKNSYKLNLNLETKKLQDHQFNIGQFFSHIARSFGKSLSFLNPFQLSAFPKKTATTTTTTESNFDFGSEEVTSDTEVDVRVSTEEDLKSSSVTEGSMSTPTIKEVEIENNKYLPPTNEYLPSNIKKKYR